MGKKSMASLAGLVLMAVATPASAFCGIDNGVSFGDSPAVTWAGNSSVYWYVETKLAHILSLRLNNANDRFIIHRQTGSDVTGNDCLNSGAAIRLSTPVYGDYILADTTVNQYVVRASRDYGPPKYAGTGVFFIEKLTGSIGSTIRYGDTFRIRGTVGNAWLCVNCNNYAIGLTQDGSRAAVWKFVR